MPASATITPVSGVDFNAARAVGYYGGSFVSGVIPDGMYPGPSSRAQKVMWRFGKEPGEAHLLIPNNAIDDIMPAVAGVRTSPIEQIKRRDICIVTAQLNPIKKGANNPDDPELTIFAGRVFSITPSMKSDGAIVVAKDHRWILDDVSVVGSWWSNVYATDSDYAPVMSYRQGVKIHLNPNNQPNCIWVEVNDDLIPTFCSPYYGITNATFTADTTLTGAGFTGGFVATTVPKPTDYSTTVACYWTPATFWKYLRYHTSQAAKDAANALGVGNKFPEYAIVHPLVDWPANLEDVIADNTPQSRKAFDRTYHCHKLMPILQELCEAAGPFAVDMHYNDDGSNTMQIVRTRYNGVDGTQLPSGSSSSNAATQGISLTRAVGGQAKDDMTGPTVIDAQLTVSAANLQDVVSEVGQHPMIELRWATPLLDGTLEEGYARLEPTASPQQLKDASALLNSIWNFQQPDGSYKNDLNKYLPGIFKQYDICSSFRLAPGFDFQVGTDQAGYPVALVGRIPLSQLLTLTTAKVYEYSSINSRYKVMVEYNPLDDDENWIRIDPDPQMTIAGDGTIYFTEYRDAQAMAGRDEGKFYTIIRDAPTAQNHLNTVSFRQNRIRMTLAVPCDHRITTPVAMCGIVSGHGAIPLGDIDTDDTANINFNNGIATVSIDTGELLASEERSLAYPSYPISPTYQIRPGTPYPPADSESNDSIALYGDSPVLRDDRSYGYDQANRKMREFGRLERNGLMPSDRMDLMAKPGDMIDTIVNTNGTDYPVKAVRKMVEHDFDKQQTISHLA
jgi:hypothetical protein